jgi:hypothetical protein
MSDFLKLIDKGRAQPASEPTFFAYPVGYRLQAANTSYSVQVGQLRMDGRDAAERIVKLEAEVARLRKALLSDAPLP